MYRISNCPVCGSTAHGELLSRPSVPVHQNLLMSDRAAARKLARGALTMRFCKRCEFVFNQAFDPTLVNYSQQYDNTQTCSEAFGQYVADLVHYLIHKRKVRGASIVEIGCGKGDFIRRLVADPQADNRGYGFDPTYVGEESEFDGRLRFEKCFYDKSRRDVPADVVICRHVIEHLSDPLGLLRSLRETIGSGHTRVYFETPCVEWILEHQVTWDFFYEHCSIFTAYSLARAFELAGFNVSAVRHVFGGQYLWLEARPARTPRAARPLSGNFALLAEQFVKREAERTGYWTELVRQLASRERLALWGAGAKGVTFANLVDPDAELIDCVVDVNPQKQGHYLPGTGHPIVSPNQLAARGASMALVLNPNYTPEIRDQLKRCGSPAVVHDLMAA